MGVELPIGVSAPRILLIWMNVASLIPWLSGLYTAQFVDDSGLLLFFSLVVMVVRGGKLYLPTPPP